jgi:hypothetical protein
VRRQASCLSRTCFNRGGKARIQDCETQVRRHEEAAPLRSLPQIRFQQTCRAKEWRFTARLSAARDSERGLRDGGSQIVAPLGIPLVPPTSDDTILYAECQADMIKVWKAIIDTVGNYARPDISWCWATILRRWSTSSRTSFGTCISHTGTQYTPSSTWPGQEQPWEIFRSRYRGVRHPQTACVAARNLQTLRTVCYLNCCSIDAAPLNTQQLTQRDTTLCC